VKTTEELLSEFKYGVEEIIRSYHAVVTFTVLGSTDMLLTCSCCESWVDTKDGFNFFDKICYDKQGYVKYAFHTKTCEYYKALILQQRIKRTGL
jgi:hypothetical protein